MPCDRVAWGDRAVRQSRGAQRVLRLKLGRRPVRTLRLVTSLVLIGVVALALLAGHDASAKGHRRSGCPKAMVRVMDFCVDRYEAPNRRGRKPLVMQSAEDADAWCTAHGKRLCTEDEWIGTCEGEEHRAYPYGTEHVDGRRCRRRQAAWKQVDEAVLARVARRGSAGPRKRALPGGAERLEDQVRVGHGSPRHDRQRRGLGGANARARQPLAVLAHRLLLGGVLRGRKAYLPFHQRRAWAVVSVLRDRLSLLRGREREAVA